MPLDSKQYDAHAHYACMWAFGEVSEGVHDLCITPCPPP